ncbi:FMN-binding negative transcriptional regulator [Pseudooceanicola sp.]|uniref:FMN-binding negative transcriptional regulator n=1 Tax=Pseudooceanicola sp. TaxID=1914328 RepID=UPI002628B5A3|nr:FMN-binding negative transcriptional regulator [Pseudooceanicola sp.]MDF1855408.1 FMN-binding negative transcriptional regulator [Pseudooceanicola sp.]
MHPNRAYRDISAARNLDFARQQGFGILTVANGDAVPLVSHLPFILSADGREAELHLARPNPIVAALAQPRAARIVVAGPHGYISPDWYQAEDQVPTWNYVAVHLTGQIELRDPDGLGDLLDRQSATFENRLLPKAPWLSSKMTPGLMDRMMRGIVPVRLVISAVDGTWKLAQNKPDAVRLAAADGVAAAGDPGLAALMRDPPPREHD